jgi:hypothetical protein
MEAAQSAKKIRDGKAARTVGFVCLGLFVLAIVLSIATKGGSKLGMILFFLSLPLFIILFIVSGVRGVRARRYRRYLELIALEQNIGNLAVIAGIPVRQTKRDIEIMLRKGYVVGWELNAATQTLIKRRRTQQVVGAVQVQAAEPAIVPVQPVLSVLCPGCGARNTVRRGQVAECEFCGAAIEGK